jgi:GNAT superfamily N-acetyltransferase
VVRYRPATTADADLIAELFVLTADWRPGPGRGRAFWAERPEFATYTADWGRLGDGGIIAEDDGGFVGGVWWRLFLVGDPGYGFVDDRTPEIGIAVIDERRGAGIGRELLRAAIARHPRLSLNVEDGNPARALYEAAGFVPVGRSADGTVMLRSAEENLAESSSGMTPRPSNSP